jgi:hypothetical protein
MADLLMKPMHRITRYPLLLKRLLGYIPAGTKEHIVVDELLTDIEERVTDIDETVRRNESAYRLRWLDNNLDFNNQIDKFTLEDNHRELLLEKAFVMKKGSNTSDVLVLIMTDMVIIIKAKKGEQMVLAKPPIPLELALFLDMPDTEEDKNIFCILHSYSQIHHLKALSKHDKLEWLKPWLVC